MKNKNSIRLRLINFLCQLRVQIILLATLFTAIAFFSGFLTGKFSTAHPHFSILIPLCLLFIFAGMILTFYLMITRSLNRPVKELYDATRQVSHGNMNLEFEIRGHSEIRTLAESYRRIVNEIKAYAEVLELIIETRTNQLKVKNDELQTLNQRVIEQSQFKSHFLASMSHEIRTPLNAIIGFTQLLIYHNYQVSISDLKDLIRELIQTVNDADETGKPSVLTEFFRIIEAAFADEETTPSLLFSQILNKAVELSLTGNWKIPADTKDEILGKTGYLASLFIEEQEKINHALKSTLLSSQYLLKLINSILDISKIESGKTELVMENVAFKPFVREIHQEVLAYQRSKNKLAITIIIDLTPSLPEFLHFDRTRMKEVLLNLLSNAIKFTESGSVTLKAEYTGSALIIRVIDTGIGISEKNLSRLFIEFSRFENAANIEGTGLGLSITKKIIELHRGTISVTSKIGQGTEFLITLPDGPHHRVISPKKSELN